MSSKKVTNLVIMAVMAFALILAIQGILGVLDKFKSDEPAGQGAPSTIIPLLPSIDQELPQGLTPEDIQKISSAFGNGPPSGLTDQLEQGLSTEDLKQTLDQAEFLAYTLQGRSWDVVKETCD